MRNYKACGEDQVFAETWKYAGNKYISDLSKLNFRKNLDNRTISRTMDDSFNQTT